MKQKFFDLASKLAKQSTHHQHFFGAVIVDKNKIVSVGTNKVQTHPKSKHSYNMLHAELSALFSAKWKDLKGCDIYVYRENLHGKSGMSRPCKVCEAALREAGIRKVYYTTETGVQEERY